jgi:uncharacterized Zn finger protein
MNRGWWPAHESKRPPPEHGIKVKKPGATWWGARWIGALERLSGDYAGRLARGKTYARTGRTHDFDVKPGEVTARVTGTREPYTVRIALVKLDDATWARAIDAMAKKATFAASLLAGEMPREIDEAFGASKTSLFPMRTSDLDTSCSCPDWANPCKHVAATHYVIGDAIDRDPFLLFELRGRKKEEVLDALRKARAERGPPLAQRRAAPRAKNTRSAGGTSSGGASTGADSRARAGGDRGVPSTVLRASAFARYDAWRTPPPDLALTMAQPSSSGALLRHLGEPASWREPPPLATRLADIVRAASDAARKLALDEPEHPPEE